MNQTTVKTNQITIVLYMQTLKVKTEAAGSNAIDHHPETLIRAARSSPCPCSVNIELSAVSSAPLGKEQELPLFAALQSICQMIPKLSFHFNPSCQRVSSTHQDNFRNMNSVNSICFQVGCQYNLYDTCLLFFSSPMIELLRH